MSAGFGLGREAALPKAEKQAQERTVPNGRKSEVLSCLNLWVSQLISFASVQSVALQRLQRRSTYPPRPRSRDDTHSVHTLIVMASRASLEVKISFQTGPTSPPQRTHANQDAADHGKHECRHDVLLLPRLASGDTVT